MLVESSALGSVPGCSKEVGVFAPPVLRLGRGAARGGPRPLAHHLRGRLEESGGAVVVFDGSEETARLQRKLGLAKRPRGRRLERLDRQGLEVILMAHGSATTSLVAGLFAAGVPALGLSGVDRGLLRSDFLNREKLGWRGGPPRVDRAGLLGLLGPGQALLVSPVALGPEGPLALEPDTLAHSLAVALRSPTLDFLDPQDTIRTVTGVPVVRASASETEALVRERRLLRGRISTVQAALAALSGGVRRVRIGNLASLEAGRATEMYAT